MRYALLFLLRRIRYLCFELNNIPVRDDFYVLLELGQDATQDEIKRAYQQQCSKLHPDKLIKRGKEVTKEDQARYKRIEKAYKVLSRPRMRDIYDAIGERGLKLGIFLEKIDRTCATSHVVCRLLMFAIIAGVYIIFVDVLFYYPYLVCLKIDGSLRPNETWVWIFIPLWVLNAIVLMFLTCGTEHSLSRWIAFYVSLLACFEIMTALKLDGVLPWTWYIVFIPLFIWEVITLCTALWWICKGSARVNRFSNRKLEDIQELWRSDRNSLLAWCFRIAFELILLSKLEGYIDWNWWLVFTPFWMATCLFFYLNYIDFLAVRKMAVEEHPTLFCPTDENDIEKSVENYGGVGKDGEATAAVISEAAGTLTHLTEAEEEKLVQKVVWGWARLCLEWTNQILLLIMVLIFVGKIQGADYTAVWILFPYMTIMAIQLCIGGCIIVCPS